MKKNIIILVSFLILNTVYLHADLTVNIPFDPNVTGPAYNDSTYNYTSEYFDVINNGSTDSLTVDVNYIDLPGGWSLIWCHEYHGGGGCHMIGFKPWKFLFDSGDTLKLDFSMTVGSAGSVDFFYKFTAPSLADSVLLNFSYTTGYSIDDPHHMDQALVTNSPNPFSENTTISFTVPENYNTLRHMAIYNIKGELIKSYDITPEMSSVTWNGTDEHGQIMPNGVYFYSISANNEIIGTEKLLLLK